jgi:metal-sulfur cluster biosynthetic enzyme
VTMVELADVRAALAEVQDPELPVGIVDLGLVRSVTVDGGAVRVGITFTSIACPCTDVLSEDIRARLRQLDGVTDVEVEEVFEAWSRDDLTEEGRLALLALGVT